MEVEEEVNAHMCIHTYIYTHCTDIVPIYIICFILGVLPDILFLCLLDELIYDGGGMMG